MGGEDDPHSPSGAVSWLWAALGVEEGRHNHKGQDVSDRVADAIAEAAQLANECGAAVLYSDLKRADDELVALRAREAELQAALRELLGSYEALVGRADVTRERAMGWDGPVCARRALTATTTKDKT